MVPSVGVEKFAPWHDTQVATAARILSGTGVSSAAGTGPSGLPSCE